MLNRFDQPHQIHTSQQLSADLSRLQMLTYPFRHYLHPSTPHFFQASKSLMYFPNQPFYKDHSIIKNQHSWHSFHLALQQIPDLTERTFQKSLTFQNKVSDFLVPQPV